MQNKNYSMIRNWKDKSIANYFQTKILIHYSNGKRKSTRIIKSMCIKGNYSNHANHEEHPKLELIAESIY